MTITKKDLTITKAISYIYEQVPQNEDNDTVKEFLSEEIVELQKENTSQKELISQLEDEVREAESDLRDEQNGHRSERNELEEERDKALSTIEDAKLPDNLYDEQKREIILRLEKNLSLESLQELEGFARRDISNYILD